MNNIQEQSRLQGLAALIQKWAELCQVRAQKEMSPHLQWLIQGMSIAHQLDAWRARDLCKQPTKGPPLGDLGLITAFESLLNMCEAISSSQENVDEIEEGDNK